MSEASGAQTMSMLVELEQQEAALLWADLVRFKKGTKRVQRLKLLAFQGLLWERGVVGSMLLYAVFILAGDSLPYQDAPPELLKAQAASVADHERLFGAGAGVLLAGLVLALSLRSPRKAAA